MASIMTWNLQEARVLFAPLSQLRPLSVVASHVSFGGSRPTGHGQGDHADHEDSRFQ